MRSSAGKKGSTNIDPTIKVNALFAEIASGKTTTVEALSDTLRLDNEHVEKFLELAPVHGVNIKHVLSEDDYAVFRYAALHGSLPALNKLVELAPRYGLKIRDMLLARKCKAFLLAVTYREFKAIDWLVELAPKCGVNIKDMLAAKGYAAFCSAVGHYDFSICEKFIQLAAGDNSIINNMLLAGFYTLARNASVISPEKFIELASRYGVHAKDMLVANNHLVFCLAAKYGSLDDFEKMFELALRYDVNVKDMLLAYDYGAFCSAVSRGNLFVIARLLELAPRYDVNASDMLSAANIRDVHRALDGAAQPGDSSLLNKLFSFPLCFAYAEKNKDKFGDYVDSFVKGANAQASVPEVPQPRQPPQATLSVPPQISFPQVEYDAIKAYAQRCNSGAITTNDFLAALKVVRDARSASIASANSTFWGSIVNFANDSKTTTRNEEFDTVIEKLNAKDITVSVALDYILNGTGSPGPNSLKYKFLKELFKDLNKEVTVTAKESSATIGFFIQALNELNPKSETSFFSRMLRTEHFSTASKIIDEVKNKLVPTAEIRYSNRNVKLKNEREFINPLGEVLKKELPDEFYKQYQNLSKGKKEALRHEIVEEYFGVIQRLTNDLSSIKMKPDWYRDSKWDEEYIINVMIYLPAELMDKDKLASALKNSITAVKQTLTESMTSEHDAVRFRNEFL